MVLIFAPKIKEVKKISNIGTNVTDVKNNSFSFRKFNLNLNFETIKLKRPKKIIKIPVCLRINLKG